MILNQLLLLSKNDIPFPEARLTIHQPTIRDIGYIGEDSFFIGCQMLQFSKQSLTEQDKNRLGDITNFEILMSIMQERNAVVQRNKMCLNLVLLLLFPKYKISFTPTAIVFQKDNQQMEINKTNFEKFQNIIQDMFGLNQVFQNKIDYNPGNARAKALADKFKKYHEKLAEIKKTGKEGQNITILSRYISILAVGEQKDINSLLDYSVFQLFDEFQRFRLKMQNDIYIQAKMAGAKDLKESENWMKDIYSNTQE